jgi:histone-lysine N-methyltransferase SETMAR
MAFTFQGRSIVSWRWRTVRTTKHQQNNRKCRKSSRNHPRRPSPNNPWAHRHRSVQSWSLPGDHNRKSEHAPHFCEVCSPTLDRWSKQQRIQVNVYVELQEKANEDPTFICISTIIRADEIWIYGYDPETKQQSSQWKNPQPPRAKRARQVRIWTKGILIVSFDVNGIVHRDFVLPNTTVNSDLLWHFETLERLELWCNHNWLLHHDNAPAHMSLKTTEFWLTTTWLSVPHPPYSPVLAPCDFSFYPKLKMKLKGQSFEAVSDIQRESQAVLDSIRKVTPRCFWCLEKMMEPLHTFPRRLFSRRWQSNLSNLRQHFFLNLVPELSNTPKERGGLYWVKRSVRQKTNEIYFHNRRNKLVWNNYLFYE